MATCSEHTERDDRNSTGNSGRTSPDNQTRSIERVTESFEGRAMTRVRLRGEWWFAARHVGRALNQGDDGKQFVRNVTEGGGVDGVEYIEVTGDELGAVSAALNDGVESPPSSSPANNQAKRGGARSMVLLSEFGLYMGLMRSRTKAGAQMRLWLAREVIPAIRKTGSYAAPTATIAELAELRERINVLEAGGSNGGVIGEWFAQVRIIRPLRYAASLRAAVNGCSFKSAYRSLLNVLEREARYGKGGELWRSFPAAPERVSSVLAFVQRTVTVAEREHRAWVKTRPAGQASLFDHFAA